MEGIPASSREGEGLGPLSVTATVEVCQPRREGDRWRQLRGQRPATLSSQRGGGGGGRGGRGGRLSFRTVTNHIYK